MKVDGLHHVTAITADIEANGSCRVAADRMADRLQAGMFVAAFVGLSLPVVGVGITLSRHVSPKDTILGFAIAVSAGIAASAIKLVGRTTPGPGDRQLLDGAPILPTASPVTSQLTNPKNGGLPDVQQNQPG